METNRTGLEVAIVGMAGRFPGANNVEDFWKNLVNGVESIKFFTDEELIEEGLDPALVKNPNYVKAKGVVEDVEYFDHAFFDYSLWEAEAMDPQLRVMHEVAWQALEDAAYNPDRYQGSIGVYSGASPNLVWMTRFMNRISMESVAEQYQVGIINDRDFFSTRLSYKLNLRGPAYTVQTACSTSLVAVHLACQGLLSGDCDIALAGGTSILLPKKHGYLYQEGMILSPDGHCKAFDTRANGTVGGDGVALVALKRLEDAIADRDHIYAIIKGTACNNDGNRKVGYTAPSIEGQAELIGAAHRMAEVEPESIRYIEAHGTGTSVGDPIEVEGLRLAFDTEQRGFCKIGSVKTNIGHLDATAGVAGLIKTALALKHKKIPASLNFQNPNPKIDFVNSPFVVNTELSDWERDERYPLRAGVNSYGIGGTNAHVILEETEVLEPSSESRPWQMLFLSAKSNGALERNTENLVEYLKGNPDQKLADIAYTLQVGRKAFPYRRSLVCRQVDEAIEILTTKDRKRLQTAVAKGDGEYRPVTFMFSGQGSQYVQMGLELYETESVFRAELDRCLTILQPLMNVDLKEVLYPETDTDSGQINETEITQPLIFAFEYTLAKLLMSWGIEPTAMIGHSIGEYVAAALSGVYSLEDGLKLVALRGQLMQKTAGGSMLSVPLAEEVLKPLIKEPISLAAVNSPELCVVSGPDQEIDLFAAHLKELGHECRKLHTSHAFHSSMMDSILDEFRAEISKLSLHEPQIPYLSNVSGTWITKEEVTDPDYWVAHLRGTVRFEAGIREILEQSEGVLLEVGPGRALATFAKQHPAGKQNQLILNLVRHPRENLSDCWYLFDKMGRLWLGGVEIDWDQFYVDEERARLSLPTYSFDRNYFNISVPQMGQLEQMMGAGGGFKQEKVATPIFERTELPENFLSPRNELEEQMASVFEEVLGMDKISVDENFFELGGDSLKALVITSKVKQKFSVEVPLADFFNHPTIAEMAEYLGQSTHQTTSLIEPAEKQEYYPLSTAQNREYIVEQLAGGTVVNNISHVLQIDGEIDLERFEEAIQKTVQVHESLRTGFEVVELEPMQKIYDQIEIKLETLEGTEENVEELIHQLIRPFDLSQPPLFRVGLIQLATQKYIFVLDMHHIIGDGTSTGILVENILKFYQGEEVETGRIQYKDYAVWQKEQLESAELQKQKEYWLEHFQGKEMRVNLPTDLARPATKGYAGDQIICTLDQEQSLAFKQIGVEQGATLYMNLLATFNLLLSKYSGQEEITIGTAIAGRSHADLQGMIGMFVNLLVFRNRVDEELTYKEFLQMVKESSLQAFENQDFPFDQLVAELNIKRDPSRSPFFDVALNVQNYQQPEVNIQGVRFAPYEYQNMTAQYDLTLNAWDLEDGIQLDLNYSTELFTPETIQKMADHLVALIGQVVEDQNVQLKDLSLAGNYAEAKVDLQEDELDFEF